MCFYVFAQLHSRRRKLPRIVTVDGELKNLTILRKGEFARLGQRNAGTCSGKQANLDQFSLISDHLCLIDLASQKVSTTF
jgi:hypothetical protein